jgi:hypothetical protein
MRTTKFVIAAACLAAALSTSARADGCGGVGQASNPTDEDVTIVFYNQTGADAGAYWADVGGDIQFQNTVSAGGSQEFGSYVGSTWYVEAEVDGNYSCLGPITLTIGGECQVDLVQDADQFYLTTAGACSN